jgi:hypothetical protein
MKRQYKAPEPYLKKRFENFLTMPPNMKTNAEAYDKLRVEGIENKKGRDMNDPNYVQGWSFVSPKKINE